MGSYGKMGNGQHLNFLLQPLKSKFIYIQSIFLLSKIV